MEKARGNEAFLKSISDSPAVILVSMDTPLSMLRGPSSLSNHFSARARQAKHKRSFKHRY